MKISFHTLTIILYILYLIYISQVTPNALAMCLNPSYITVKGYERAVAVQCGKCIECLSQRSNEWAYRILLESKYYLENCFITLTYKDNPVNLSKRDLQLFIKRLRKALAPKKIRYFACGEYGKKGLRPHYHIIIFNYYPNDIICNVPGEENLYRSKLIEQLWQYGFSSVGKLEFDSAKYCAKYMQKLNTVKELVPPFTIMSTKPGIGYNYLQDNTIRIIDDKIYHNGKYIKLPRYFLKVLERDGYDLTDFKERRLRNALQFETVIDTDELKRKRKKQNIFTQGY